MKGSFPKRLKSLRDPHRRSKSSEPGHKQARPLSSDNFFNMFKSETARQAAKEEAEKERVEASVEAVASRIEEMHLHSISRDHVRFALMSKYAEGDVDKAVDLIRLQQQAFSGTLLPYNPNAEMLGAENRGNVTCYLDALLFAMYAKLQAFDCMLVSDQLHQLGESQRNLAALIRLWVNMLRAGKLIRTDMAETLQNALADCGWHDARLLEQQDTSEAFAFITETLQLPLLTLQVDLFHQGKGDADDHKVVYERLLNLAVPPDPENKGVKLEDCLEDYFNTRVDVLRDSPEEVKAAEKSALSRADAHQPGPPGSSSTEGTVGTASTAGTGLTDVTNGTNGTNGTDGAKDMGAVNRTDISGSAASVANTEQSESATIATPPPAASAENQQSESSDIVPQAVRRWTLLEPYTLTTANRTASAPVVARSAAAARQRSASIIQRFVVENGVPSAPHDPSSLLQEFKRQRSTIIKAVTIPAWQFFRLIPWHSTSNSEPLSDMEVARQFNKRPVVGICLKRYTMNNVGQFLRQNTYIDIPDSLRLPYFMMGEDGRPRETTELSADFKLVLQSVVCHRGVSLHSGHYISFARVNPKLLTDNRRHELDPPPDYEEEQWVKFDDLALDSRVTYVDDIKAALKEEMPYLLFYQIMPMVDLSPSTTGEANEPNSPPSYNALAASTSAPRLPTDRLDTPGNAYPDSSTWGGSTTTGPSIRFSSEFDRPRPSLDDDSNTSSILTHAIRRAAEGVSRRGSAVFSSSMGGTPVITPEGGRSPIIAASDESTAQRLSRAAARLTGKAAARSRPPSQAGEGRLSLTMSRLGLVRSGKEPLRLPDDGADASTTTAVPAPLSTTQSSSAALTTVCTAPAAQSFADQHHDLVPSADGLAHPILLTPSQPLPHAQLDGQDDTADLHPQYHEHHHHHHLHHHHMRRKDKENDAGGAGVHADGTEYTTASGSGKWKGKEKAKGKSDVPERECSVM